MSKNSLFTLKNTRNHVSRNGFDLSNKNSFTAKAGELLPVYFKNVLPGDKFKCSVQHFTRTQAVQTAAFTRFKEEFSWYFVPYRLMWRYFPSVINRLGNQTNSASGLQQSPNVGTDVPYFTLSSLCSPTNTESILGQMCSSHGVGLKNVVGFQFGNTTAKLLSYLGYCFIPDTYVDDLKKTPSQGGHTLTPPYQEDMKVSPFPLLAYQKIYMDYYRNTQWENNNPSAFNVDYVGDPSNSMQDPFLFSKGVPTAQTATDGFYTNGMFTLRYNNWRKDMLQGILPSSQYGDVSIVTTNSGDAKLDGSTTIPGTSTTVKVGNDVVYTKNATETTASMIADVNGNRFDSSQPLGVKLSSRTAPVSMTAKLQTTFDVLQLRKAQALQKLKEITQAHDLTIKEQMYAHWNVDVPDVMSQECIYLGSCTNNIDINEVVNQNLFGADDNGKATIAGKGVGSDSSFCCDFNAKEHGIIMCLYTCTPLLDYENIGTDMQLVQSDISDFPTPEFDRLGLDVLPFYALQNSTATRVHWSGSLGYTSRYIDYKTSFDKVNGGFLVGDLTTWVAPVSRGYLDKFQSGPLDYRYFKVAPSILNPIFGFEADSAVTSDQLLVNANFDVKVVRNLDFSGMPY